MGLWAETACDKSGVISASGQEAYGRGKQWVRSRETRQAEKTPPYTNQRRGATTGQTRV